jgi:hypothetical protein
MEIILVLLLFWILGAVLCGIVAASKGLSAAWGFAALLFSPLLTLLALIAIPAVKQAEPAPTALRPPPEYEFGWWGQRRSK